MNNKKLIVVLLAMMILMIALVGGTQAAAPDEIEQAISDGITWLVSRQEEDGSWNPWGDPVGHTGFAVVKLADRAFETGYDPFDPAYMYSTNVTVGLDFIFSQAAVSPCDNESIVFASGHNETYNTGIAMMAIAASRAPERVVDVPGSVVDGWTYRQVLQANVKYFACSQIDDGGWRYEYPEEWADNSATGYAVLGLAYAESPLCGFENTIPDGVKSGLNNWVNDNQVSGDTPHEGGSGYSAYDNTSNLLRAGNLIFEMAFLGDTPDSPRMQRALAYLGRAWNDPDWSWWDIHSYPGWYGNPDWHGDPIHQEDPPDWWQGLEERWWGWQGPHFQAMYCMMKGLSFAGVNSIAVNGVEVDWFDAFADRILEIQMEDGSWPRDYWGGDITATEWALLTLERSAPPQGVPVDIKPTSCPNPLNVDKKGVLPAAILGTADFDTSTIDPASVQLAGISPLSWSWEDVATPYEPYTGKSDAYDCNEYGADGYMDLTLKFDAQEVVAALGDVYDGDVLVIDLTGNLQEAYGGTPFFGEDVVRIVKKKGATECNELVLLHSFGLPSFSHLNDLAFDGEFLWLSGYDSGTISKLDMDGNVLSSFSAPGPFHHPTGLTFDGEYLWSTDDLSLEIYKLDLSGNVLTSYDGPGVDSTGLAFEGNYLWNADFNWGVPGGYLHRIDISDADDISFTTFDSPGEGPSGLAFDGKYLWLTDAYDNTIYKLDTSANVLCSYPSYGGHPLGLTFDGKYLWLSAFETKTIYKIDIGKN